VTPSLDEERQSASKPTENFEAYQLYLKGRNAMRGQQDVKNVELAIGLYEEALKKDPHFAHAYAGIADSSLQMYQESKERLWADRALAAAQQARSLNENLFEVHLALGNVYQATGRNAEAIAELRRALELQPNSDDAYRRLGRTYLRSGRAQEAIQAYERAVQVNPYYWRNHESLGAAHLRLGASEKAAQAFRRVVELEPDNVNGYNNLGATHLQLGKYEEAAAAFQKALVLKPTAETYTNLGITYAFGGKFGDAVSMFDKAVQLSPSSELFVGNLADGYRWAGRHDEAQKTYDKAISLAFKELQVNPRNAVTRINLALYYAKRGDVTTGERYAKEALSIDSSNVNILYSQAVVHVLAKHLAEGLTALEAALRAGYPVSMAQADPDLALLRSHPGFGEVIRKFK
ncbi:MAG: tetratricopeptide repeat protein, partial [Acidimicrobiia bacterium]